MILECYGASVVGGRPYQEDTFRVDDSTGVAVVCDGLGGHPRGDEASLAGAEAFMACGLDFEAGMVAATEAVHALDPNNWREDGPATTLVACRPDGDSHVHVVNIGDSRAYVINKGRLHQVTLDHEGYLGFLTMWVPCKDLKNDSIRFRVPLPVGSWILLASDGFFEAVEWFEREQGFQVTDERIIAHLDPSDKDLASKVLAAYEGHYRDNATVVFLYRAA